LAGFREHCEFSQIFSLLVNLRDLQKQKVIWQIVPQWFLVSSFHSPYPFENRHPRIPILFSEYTFEIVDGKDLSINETRIAEESKYDGYYSIVTSEKDLSDKEIRDIYKGILKKGVVDSKRTTLTNLQAAKNQPLWNERCFT